MHWDLTHHMENALTIIVVFGGLLFIYSFIRYALAGFRYHPVTGLLALVPVVNIIALPTLMDSKIIRIIIIGIIALLLAVVAWFLGADKSLYQHISKLQGQPVAVSNVNQHIDNKQKTIISATDVTALSAQATGAIKNSAAEEVVVASSADMQIAPRPVYIVDLPKQALYNMQFIDAPVQQLSTLKGRTVRIVTRKDAILEGRLEKITSSSAFILRTGDSNIAYEMLISNIKQIKVLVKRN
jgi:hypothetical protein